MSWWSNRTNAQWVRKQRGREHQGTRPGRRGPRVEPLEDRVFLSGAPTNLVVIPNWVDENQPAGTVVGQLKATDPDAGETFTYGLVSDNAHPDNTFFAIQADKLVTRSVIDFEARPQNTYNILVRVMDSTGLWLDQDLSITVNDVNEAPTAVAHSYAAFQNTDLSVAALDGLLAGAHDPEGHPMTAMLVADHGPQHGIVELNSDGSFVYHPAHDYVGSDQFQYQVSDGQLESAAATVTIAVDYGPDPVVQLPTNVSGGNNAVLARVGDHVRLVNFTTGQMMLDKVVDDDFHSLEVVGAELKPNTLTIDSSMSGTALPGGVTFKGANGALADKLVIRGGGGADTLAVAANSAAIGSFEVEFSNVEQLVLDGAAGNDTYQISDLPLNTAITDSTGIDTFDFSKAATGARIDLGKSTGQDIFSNGHKLTITGTIEFAIVSDSADSIKGGTGRNLLIGRGGADTLNGGSGDDILIGGTTAYDDSYLALAAIMREWSSTRSYQKRCDRLAAGFIDPVAGWIRLAKGATVLDDAVGDHLFGSAGSDWFFDFLGDVVYDRLRNER